MSGREALKSVLAERAERWLRARADHELITLCDQDHARML